MIDGNEQFISYSVPPLMIGRRLIVMDEFLYLYFRSLKLAFSLGLHYSAFSEAINRMILRDMDNMLATYGTVDLSVKGCGGVAMSSSQRICYPLLVSRGFQIPISDTADCKSAVTVNQP